MRLTSILLLAFLVTLLAGCGGDRRRGEAETSGATNPTSTARSSEPASSGSKKAPPVTKVTDPARRAYLARVDAVCGTIEPERGKEQERVGAAADSAEAAKAYEGTIALGWRELRQIEAIAPPPGDEALLRANVFHSVKGQLALRAEIRSALAAADVPWSGACGPNSTTQPGR